MGYRVAVAGRFVTVDRPRLLVAHLTGDLQGTGRLQLVGGSDRSDVGYEIDVATTKPWMSALEPVVRPVLAWNHDCVVADTFSALGSRLGVMVERV